jgi:hypothetical protein
VQIRFPCPACDYPAGRLDATATAEWHCPQCDHIVRPSGEAGPELRQCLLCGNGELYKKKDFPHSLGMAILALACVASTLTYWLYNKYWTWGILIGSAAFDGLLYLWVKDAVVCYRCNAHYRSVPPGSVHAPFELTIHERYRQERARREEMQNAECRMQNERQRS